VRARRSARIVSRVVVVLPVEALVLGGELIVPALDDGAAIVPDEVVDPEVPAFTFAPVPAGALFEGYADGGEVPALKPELDVPVDGAGAVAPLGIDGLVDDGRVVCELVEPPLDVSADVPPEVEPVD
jgi:hypothetical protein